MAGHYDIKVRPPLRPLRGGQFTPHCGAARRVVGSSSLCFRESIRKLICIVQEEQDRHADKRSVMSIESGWWAPAGLVQVG